MELFKCKICGMHRPAEDFYFAFGKKSDTCKICGKELPDGEYLHVDHNKETGEVRGLLCKDCNIGLGSFKDNPESLINAAKYIEETKCQEQ